MPRDIPQYISQLSIGSRPVVQLSTAGAMQTQNISKQLGELGQDMQEKASQIEKLNATATLRENLHRMSLEAGADVGTLKSNIEGFKSGFIKGIKNPAVAEEFQAKYGLEALPFIDQATEKYNKNLDTQHETSVLNAQRQNIASMGAIAPNLTSNVPEIKKAAQDSLDNIFKDSASNAMAKKSDGTYMFTPEQQFAMAGEAQKEFIIALPPEQRLEALGVNTGGFDSAIATVLKNEGGYSASDGNTGNPVNFGINQKAHPEVDVKNLTQDQAKEIYKKDYWDKYGVDQLRPDQQAIVMDGVVNHGSTFAQKLVDAAKAGANPSELINMRQQEYDRLAKSGKYPDNVVQSWDNRLSGFEHLTLGEHLNYLTPEIKNRLKDETIKAINEENKLKAEDPAKWGLMRGMNIDQIVQMQGNTENASVMPKETAKELTQKAKDFTSADDIIKFAGQLQSSYGQYTYNAVKDLTDAKLPDETQAAINLAIQNPIGNHERIRLLYETSKLGDKGIDEAYKVTTFSGLISGSPGDPKNIDAKLVGDSSDTLQAMSREGYTIADMNRNFNITSAVAKAYRIKNPSVSEGDAIDFALSLEKEKYGIASLNGIQYRVPKVSPNGTVYDVNEIEDRLKSHYDNIEFKANVTDAAIAKNIGENLKKLAVPFLNAKQDGVRFRSPSGEVLLDTSGKIAELKFKDIIDQPTPYELRQEEINKSFR